MTTSGAPTRSPSHLSDEALDVLRSSLLSTLGEHADQAAEYRATAEELTGELDTDSQLEREIAEVSASHLDAAVDEARAALRRFEDGTYGLCDSCRAPIPLERLEAIPHTRHCVACAAEAARNLA